METNQTSEKVRDVYQIITNRILEQLEKGEIPWRKTWTNTGLPRNLATGKEYKGANIWLLTSLGFPLNYFMTFQQLKELGGNVREGEKSNIVVYWKWIETENPTTGKVEHKPFLRYYRVYNIAQTEGIPESKIPKVIRPKNPIDECEYIIKTMPKCPLIINRGDQPYYNPKDDFINMPPLECFETSENYYETLFHELVHSTGHVTRLNRKEIVENHAFGSELYSIEELTAEMGSCMLKSLTGIRCSVTENNIGYIQSWIKVLQKNRKFIVYASLQAQRAVEFVLSEEKVKETPETGL
jgi:antirestriction protein ArdC